MKSIFSVLLFLYVHINIHRTWSPKYGPGGKFSANMEPYIAEDRLMPKESSHTFFASIMSGIKSTFEWKPASGAVSLQLDHDGGATSSPRGRAKFHVVELVGKVNAPAASSLFYLAHPLKSLIGSLRKKSSVQAPVFSSDMTDGSTSEEGTENFLPPEDEVSNAGQFIASTQQRIKL